MGCPRSGTTLIQAVLAAHPRAATFPETKFFTELFGSGGSRVSGKRRSVVRVIRDFIRLRLGIAWPRARIVLNRLEQIARMVDAPSYRPEPKLWMADYVAAYLKLLDGCAVTRGKDLWMEKTPDHVYFIDVIERYVPGAKFIHIVRRGQNVVASLLDGARKYGQESGFPDSVERAVTLWNSSVSWHQRYYGQRNHHHLSFEKFVENPEHEARRACKFCGIEYAPEMLIEYNVTSAKQMKVSAAEPPSVMGPIKPPEYKFKSVLSEAQQQYAIANLLPNPGW